MAISELEVDLTGVCAIGASAGGLEPLETFFGSIPTDTNLAFVVIQHLSPDHESMMDSLLGRHTSMPVNQADDGDELQANHVYLIPPDHVLTVEGSTLRLNLRDRSSSTNASPHPIDAFFSSLAEQWGASAAAIVLSGTGNDGAAGTEEVRRSGGLTLAQDSSASFEGMPTAADQRGYVDAIASVPAMASHVTEFFQLGKRPSTLTADSRYTPVEVSIIADLAASTGINFRDYKRGTVRRRIEHHMNAVGASTVTDLAERVRSSTDERSALTNDILIGVTSFFRDTEVYDTLSRGHIEKILADAHGESRSARAWVVGCATGQEAYSMAMLLVEARQQLGLSIPIQVFATDVHEGALATATEGVYTTSEMEGVSPARRDRFFRSHADGWRVRDDLRSIVTFARHNMLTDTPFSRIDLVSCRNTMIYFTPTAQQRALWALGFALRPQGLLLLGSSESPGFLVPDFEPLSATDRLFVKTGDSAIKSFRRRMGPDLVGGPTAGMSIPRPSAGPDQALLRAYDAILDQHFVGGLIIDNRNEVIHVLGSAKSWIQYGTGRPTLDVHALVEDPGLRLAISGVLRDLAEPGNTDVQKIAAIEGSPVVLRGQKIRSAGSSYSFISAQPVDVPIEIPTDVSAVFDAADLDRIGQLESDLAYTRESLQASLEEQETSNEELNAANEELIASNEELQSSNEELSALNEELRTLNDEHHRRLQEVLELTADLEQILTSTEIGIVLLDAECNIRRFSDPARDFFHLVASDQGRPFDHIRPRFESPDFEVVVQEALQTRVARTLRAPLNNDGGEVLVRVRPYSLPHEETGVSITTMPLGAAATSRRETLMTSVIESSPLRIYVFDEDLVCQYSSGQLLGEPLQYQGMSALEITNAIGGTSPEMTRMFETVQKTGESVAGVMNSTDGQRLVFLWKFRTDDKPYIGALAASMEALQSSTGDWVESQTLSVLANLLGVGAAVISGDGTVGERFSAFSDDPTIESPLDNQENLLALSNLVASSAELDFDSLDQTVDLFVDGRRSAVHVRGLRLGTQQSSPYLTIAFNSSPPRRK